MPSKTRQATSSKKKTSGGNESHMTTDHDVIRAWVEDRDGQPARIKQTGGRSHGGRSGGLLRIEFQDRKGSLEPIGWDEFFRIFDENNLVFLHQDRTHDKESRFFKFVSRETAEEQGSIDDDDFALEDDREPIKTGEEEGDVSKSEMSKEDALDDTEEEKEESAHGEDLEDDLAAGESEDEDDEDEDEDEEEKEKEEE